MKILEITPRLPYPLTDGALICMYQVIHGLASQGHEVHLVSLNSEGGDPTPLREFATVHTVNYQQMPRPIGALSTLFSSRPYTQKKRELPKVYRLLDDLHHQEHFDAVCADEAHVACYGSYMKRTYGIPYLLRCHNVEHEIYQRHIATVQNPLFRAYLKLQLRRWARYESEEIALADVSAAITQRDQKIFERMVPGAHIETIPAAVDLDAFSFTGVDERQENSLIVLGNMSWPPNRDAAIWFANDILPMVVAQIPDVVCYLVGEDPPLKQLPAPSKNLRIEGRVPSIHDYFRSVSLGVIPLRVGGGMRVKMVEMMASGIPIISTSQGAEGNEAIKGTHYVGANDPSAIASAIIRLLRDRSERERLSCAARKFVLEYYSIQKVSKHLEQLFYQIVENNTKIKTGGVSQ